VIIMQTEELDDGTTRVKVGKVSEPRGVNIETLGWVTMDSDHGNEQLRALDTEEQHDEDWRVNNDKYNRRKDKDEYMAQHNSMASRIAERRRKNRPLRKWLSYTEQGEILMPDLISQGVIEPRPAPTEALHYPSLARQRDRSKSPTPIEPKSKSPFTLKQFSGPAEQNEAWMKPPALMELADRHYAYSRVMEAKFFDNFAKRVGAMMQVLDWRSEDLKRLVAAVDLSGDRLDKVEFRSMIRKLGHSPDERPERCVAARTWLSGEPGEMGKGCPDKEINAYFGTLDSDKSGSLDISEISRSLMQLKEAINRKAYEQALSKVVGLRTVGSAFEKASELVAVSIAMPAPPPPSMSAKLGRMLQQKAVKVDSLRTSWDPDGSGKIDKRELGDAVKGLGLESTDAELDELFASFDEDGSGSLLIKELISAMKKLQSDAVAQGKAELSAGNAQAQARAQAEEAMREAIRQAAYQASWEP